MRKRLFIAALVLIGLGLGWVFRGQIREVWFLHAQPSLPEPLTYVEAESSPPDISNIEDQHGGQARDQISDSSKATTYYLPPTTYSPINLAVPFTSQAPEANWDALHEETCEEAAVLMVDAFFDGRLLEPKGVEEELQKLVEWEKSRFGYFKDTTAEETAIILREFYGYEQVEARYDITFQDILAMLSKGLPVIVPSYGRALGNPNFRGEGPVYHMLVIRGLTRDGKLITNDPGTRRGEAYLYEPEVLWLAIHDWNGGDVPNGQKVMIVVKP